MAAKIRLIKKKSNSQKWKNASYSKSINAFGGRGLKKGKLPM